MEDKQDSGLDEAAFKTEATIIPTINLAAHAPDELTTQTVKELLTKARQGGETRYFGDSEIGRGGIGAILRVVDADFGREAAKKVLLTDEAHGPRVIRFLEEAQITGQLEHPNIVPVHEIGVDEHNRPYFTMKLVKGQSLQQVLDIIKKDGPESQNYTLGELLGIFLKVCNAVAFAHSRGVLHRDLKPANVMVGEFGEVLVMDWGLAKVQGVPDSPFADTVQTVRTEMASGATIDGQIQGTAAYMPPEQATGDLAAMGERSDVYSLGAILYQILCLERPVIGDTVMATLVNVAEGNIALPEERGTDRHIPAELSAITMKALSKDSRDRYANVEAMSRDIRLFLDGRAVSAKEDTFVEALGKFVRRNKEIVVTVAVACVVVIVLSVIGICRVIDERNAALDSRLDAESQAAMATMLRNEAERAREEVETAMAQTERAKDEVLQTANLSALRFAQQAIQLVDDGRIEEASRRAEDAVVVAAHSPEGWYAKALIAQAAKNHEQAIKLFDRALKLAPHHTASQLASAESILALKNVQAAREELLGKGINSEDLSRRVDDATDAASQLADTISSSLNGTDKNNLLSDTQDWRAIMKFADAIFEIGDFEKAADAYSRALQVLENDATVEAAQVELCRRLQDLSAVERDIKGWYVKRDQLTGDQQAAEVARKFSELNHEIDGWNCRIENGRILSISIGVAAECRFLQPLRGLPLRTLRIGSAPRLVDLTPLKGMPLTSFGLSFRSKVSDLAPLAGMPLQSLTISSPELRDLSPLERLPLKHLSIGASYTDQGSYISDLNPLRSMSLRSLRIASARLTDIAPLENMPLTSLELYARHLTDLSAVASLKQLTTLKVVANVLKSIAPLKSLPLDTLDLHLCWNDFDLNMLKGKSFKLLSMPLCRDLSPLCDIRFEKFEMVPMWPSVRNVEGLENVKGKPLRLAVASVYLKQRNLKLAEQTYVSIEKEWPGSKQALLGLRAVAQTALSEGNMKQANVCCDAIKDAVKEARDGSPARMLRARSLLEEGKLSEASAELKDLVDSLGEFSNDNPPPPEAYIAAFVLGKDELIEDGKVVQLGPIFAASAPPDARTLVAEDEPAESNVEDVVPLEATEVSIFVIPEQGYKGNDFSISSLAVEFRMNAPLNAVPFIMAWRQLSTGKMDEAKRYLKQCVDSRVVNSYSRQAARLLDKMQ